MCLCFHQKPTWIYDVPKRDSRPSGLVLCLLFIYLFIYVFYQNVIQMGGWTFAWQQAVEQREPQGVTVSINRSHPPPPIFAIFFIWTNKRKYSTAQRIPQHRVLNMTIKGERLAVCITILAGKNNIRFYCNSQVYKLAQCQFINPISRHIFVIIKYPRWYQKNWQEK